MGSSQGEVCCCFLPQAGQKASARESGWVTPRFSYRACQLLVASLNLCKLSHHQVSRAAGPSVAPGKEVVGLVRVLVGMYQHPRALLWSVPAESRGLETAPSPEVSRERTSPGERRSISASCTGRLHSSPALPSQLLLPPEAAEAFCNKSARFVKHISLIHSGIIASHLQTYHGCSAPLPELSASPRFPSYKPRAVPGGSWLRSTCSTAQSPSSSAPASPTDTAAGHAPRASHCPSRGRQPPPTLESSAVFSFHQGEPCSLPFPARCTNWNRLGRHGGLCQRKYFNEAGGCLHCYLLLLRVSWLGSSVITAWIAG